eukprot:c11388_g2_i2.p1 GENE.c11388_g2_i2~~c11388_g2_i2.p1  ORF type:complete len:1002 (+),score=259.44 c11388_g2_i2:119-3124(+)
MHKRSKQSTEGDRSTGDAPASPRAPKATDRARRAMRVVSGLLTLAMVVAALWLLLPHFESIQQKVVDFNAPIKQESRPISRAFDHVKTGVAQTHHSPKYKCEEVRVGNARFQVMTDQIIRLENSQEASTAFNDRATFVIINRDVPCVPFTHTETDQGDVIITTKNMKLTYTGKGAMFDEKNVRVEISGELMPNGQTVTWYPGMPNPSQLYGTIRTLDRVSGAFSLDCNSLPIRSRHPHSPVGQHCTYGIVSRAGWVVLDDSRSPLFDDSDWPWVDQYPATAQRQDWYLLGHGLDYKRAIREFTILAGKQPIPPRFSFGVFYSRWWPWADWESISIIKEYDEYSVPLDVLVTDMDWHNTCYREQDMGYVDLAGQPACWTGWTWDDKYFPNPKAFMDWCEHHGIKNTLNLHLASGVQPWEKQFVAIATAMGLDPTKKGTYVEWNVTDKKFSTNFHEHVLGPMEDEGVDFWWLDWQQGEGWFKDTFPGLNPTFFLNYVFFTQPGRWNNGDRPIILHRWGGLGNHRYPVGFSGDVYPNWESLEYQPYMTREAANVLFGYWSHDIGGFMEPAADELYLRWIQYGVFSPIFRTHGTRLAENIKRMWHYKPEYFKAMRVAMQLRAKLLPYIYTAARIAHDSGESICAPLYYDHPTLEAAYKFKTQYKFGPDMFIAPVVSASDPHTKLVQHMKIWVPPGDWVELFSGIVFQGPQIVKRNFALEEIPVYVRSGAVIVSKLLGFEEEVERGWLGRAQEQYSALNVQMFLPLVVDSAMPQVFETMHYDDQGGSVGYLEGQYTWRHISYQITKNQIDVHIASPMGHFDQASSHHKYRITLHGSIVPLSVKLASGVEIAYQPWVMFSPRDQINTWSFDGDQMALLINLNEPVPYDQEVVLTVQFGASENTLDFTNSARAQVAGLRGRISRAKVAKHTLDSSYPETTPADYDQVTKYAETGMRITYLPELLRQELNAEPENRAKAIEHSKRFGKGFKRKESVGLEKVAEAFMADL